MNYKDLQADFYQYMVNFGGITKKTSADYVSRIKFLSETYHIDETLTKDGIDEILSQENKKRQERNVYSSKKSLSDFSNSSLKFEIKAKPLYAASQRVL